MFVICRVDDITTRRARLATTPLPWVIAMADDHHGTNSTVPNWECARERDTTQPPALHDNLAPPTKAGPFSRGQLLVNERDAGRPKRLHRPQLRGGLFRFFWRGTAVLRTAVLLQPLPLLSKRKPIVRSLFERLFEA